MLDYLRPLSLDEKVINRVEVVLEELLSNVARHADEATYLQVTTHFRDDELTLWIEDDGAAFNPLAAKDPAPFDKLEDAKLGGLGIPLIKRLSRLVEYDRVGGANRMHVVIAA